MGNTLQRKLYEGSQFRIDLPPCWNKRGEPAEGSLNLSCLHRENTYALLESANFIVLPFSCAGQGLAPFGVS